MDNFYVGQDIIAIINHSQGAFKEGDIFEIKNIKQGCCSKTFLIIDIGSKHIYNATYCNYCEISYNGNTWWFSSSMFRPLDELINIDELKEVLNQPIKQNYELQTNKISCIPYAINCLEQESV